MAGTTRTTFCALAALAGLATLLAAQDRVPGGDRRGETLAARVLAKQRTSGFRLRARISTREPGAPAAAAINIRVLGRTDATGTRVLYQALFPVEVSGYALLIERAPKAVASTGLLVEPPGRVTPLDASLRTRAFLHTDLLIDDLVEDFWRWPHQRHGGEAKMDGVACEILESRDVSAPAFPFVRSWIAKLRPVPVRIEKYGTDGALARRIRFARAERQGRDDAVPARMVVEPANGRRTTTVEFFGGERDVDVAASLFALEQLKRAAARQP